MPTFASFSSILLVMAALSAKNPGMSSPLNRDDCGLLNIVMYYEDMPINIEEIDVDPEPGDDEEFNDDEYLWDDEEQVRPSPKKRSKDANT